MTAVSDFINGLVAHAQQREGAADEQAQAQRDHSTVTREAVVAQLHFADEACKADLLDPARTNTWLVALLGELVARCPRPILITCVRTGHGVDGGQHGHNPGGDAADLWHADYATVGDAGIRDVLATLAEIAREDGPVYEVGLGGRAQNFNPGGFPAGFDLFGDNSTDHVHVSAARSGHASEG